MLLAFFSLSSVAVKKKLPFFGCRFFCTHIFLFGFCMDMSSIRLPCLDLPCASVVYASWLLFIWFSNRKSYNISRKNEKQKKWINPITEQKYIYTSHFCGIACRYFFLLLKRRSEREKTGEFLFGSLQFWYFFLVAVLLLLLLLLHLTISCAWPLVNEFDEGIPPSNGGKKLDIWDFRLAHSYNSLWDFLATLLLLLLPFFFIHFVTHFFTWKWFDMEIARSVSNGILVERIL